jgi:uncharacterized protein YbdZ (MbtH family)
MSWNDSDREDTTIYKAVVNHEEQYSIWPADRENPLGWSDAGKTGTKAECLAYIKEVWTDLRPLSLRKRMEELARNPPPPSPSLSDEPASRSSELIDRLSQGDHPVKVSLRPHETPAIFKERIDTGHVRIQFTDTRGASELGVRLDPVAIDVGKADFEAGQGTVHLEGTLNLNYTPVRCVADIDLATLQGRGRLVVLEPVSSMAS